MVFQLEGNEPFQIEASEPTGRYYKNNYSLPEWKCMCDF